MYWEKQAADKGGEGGYPRLGGGPYNLDAVACLPAYVLRGHFDAFRKSFLL
jgi:hypothetical protein